MAWGHGNLGGSASSASPEFAYTGTYTLLDDGSGDWTLKLLTSGTLSFAKAPGLLDVFLTGGGGGSSDASDGNGRTGAGGGGGYTLVSTRIPEKDTEYAVVIGAGGAVSGSGGTTTAFGLSALGGLPGTEWNGGNGGSGGGAGARQGTSSAVSSGGTDGGNGSIYGTSALYAGGTGQGLTTREFGDADGILYSKGGGANQSPQSNQPPNTGNGGNGKYQAAGFAGASGIVAIRNHRRAAA